MGDLGMTVSSATAAFAKLKAAYDSKDDATCDAQLLELKKLFIHFPTFLAPHEDSKTKAQEIVLVRETLEHGVLLSARRKDMDAFEAYFSQLQVYFSYAAALEASGAAAGAGVSPTDTERKHMLLGLNLLRLLVDNKIAEFHSELEKIPVADHKQMFLRAPVLLERYLMEGSYNKLLNARSQVPSNEFLPVVELLEDTVRSDIAACIPRTYDSLPVAAARKMLMMASDDAVREFAGKRADWHLSEDKATYRFSRAAEEAAGRHEFPFKAQLVGHIDLAADLQRVV